MERHRVLAASPVRSSTDAWAAFCKVVSDTLEKSSENPKGSVATALAPLSGLGPALIAGGHLERKAMVLVDSTLFVAFNVKTGDAALQVSEKLDAIPGGASSTSDWKLYLPETGPLDASIRALIKRAPHLAIGDPSSNKTEEKSAAQQSLMDLSALSWERHR